MIENLVYQIGREVFYIYICQHIYIIIQDIFWLVYKEYHFDLVYIYRNRLQQRRGGWICLGPNYFWFIDSYRKLVFYSFEIYVSIDTYSRFIL